jgi:heme-degrading monooxygenase HmoA
VLADPDGYRVTIYEKDQPLFWPPRAEPITLGRRKTTMTFRIVALHYPRTEHREELLHRLERAASIMRTAPGVIDVEIWKEEETGALVSTARFESRDACMAALQATAKATDIRFDEREERPRVIYNLVDLGAVSPARS